MNLTSIHIHGFLIDNLFEILNEIYKEPHILYISGRKPVSTNSILQKACQSFAIQKIKMYLKAYKLGLCFWCTPKYTKEERNASAFGFSSS